MNVQAAPLTHRGDHCACGAPISLYSRGSCRTCCYVGLKRPVPGDFLAVLRLRGSAGAAKHYRASLGTVTRWRREIGMAPQERARRPSAPAQGRTYRTAAAINRGYVNRDFSAAGQAANFLCKYGAVYRCKSTGAPFPKGEFWNRNGHVLTDEQIIERATRLGFVMAGF